MLIFLNSFLYKLHSVFGFSLVIKIEIMVLIPGHMQVFASKNSFNSSTQIT
jgi:hypothetical protein